LRRSKVMQIAVLALAWCHGDRVAQRISGTELA
jgi:hypothetical protein